MATPAKDAHSLVTHYANKYKERYGSAPVVNRYSARWGFDSILMDMTLADIKSLLEFYLTTASQNSHSLDWFFYNYDKLVVAKQRTDEDRKLLDAARDASRRRTEEWRKKIEGH